MRPKLSLLFMLLTMLALFAIVTPPNAQAAEAEKAEKNDDAKKDEPAEIGPRALTAKIVEHVVTLLRGLAWPGAVALIAWWYREELGSVLRRLKKIKAGGVDLEIDENLAKAKASADQGDLPPPPAAPPGGGVVTTEEGEADIARSAEKAKALGQISAAAAIQEMWNELEYLTGEMFRKVNGRFPRTPNEVRSFIEQLHREHRLPASSFDVYLELRQIRNKIVHLPDERNKLDKNQVEEYILLCARLIRQFLEIHKTLTERPVMTAMTTS